MADKARSLFPISVTFTDGEQPTAKKLTSIAKQAKQGLGILEYAIGDLWNQSGDALLNSVSDAALMIPNIGRFLGNLNNLSPRIIALPLITSYTHSLTTSTGNGVNECRLPFPPSSDMTPVGGTTWSFSTGSFDTTPQVLRSSVNATGKWWVNTTNGDLVFYDELPTSLNITYKPIIRGDLGSSSTFNIIPDLDTSVSYGFQGLKIAYKNGTDGTEGYYIYLPPRGPLTNRIYSAPTAGATSVPADISSNYSTSPTTEALYWQDDSIAAVDSGSYREHYRYCLPKLITDNWGNNAPVPTGFLYLWDETGTKTFIEGITFTAEPASTPRKYVLVATGANLTTWLGTAHGQSLYPDINLRTSGGGFGADHSATYYPTGGLRLVSVGSNISAILDLAIRNLFEQNHGWTNEGASNHLSSLINHGSLFGLSAQGNSLGNPIIPTSLITGDDHPQYLERHGYSTSRDQYGNAMLGDLLMASTSSTNNYLNSTSSSHAIYFGQTASPGPAIRWSTTRNKLAIVSPAVSTNPAGFYACSNDHVGVGNLFDVEIGGTAPYVLVSGDSSGAFVGLYAGSGIPGVLAFSPTPNTVSPTISVADTAGDYVAISLGTAEPGVTVYNNTGNYFIKEKTVYAVADLGAGATDTSVVNGWKFIDGTGFSMPGPVWYSHETANAIWFWVWNFPHLCKIAGIKMTYSQTTGNDIHVLVFKHNLDDITADAPWTYDSGDGTYYLPNSGLNKLESIQYRTGADSIVFSRSNEVLGFYFTTVGTASDTKLIRPWIQIAYDYTLVNPWPIT